MSRILAIGFCIFWNLVLLAGADKPPPIGFLWLVLVVAVCATVVYWRSQSYIVWRRTRRPGRYWRVMLDGLIAGFLIGLLTSFVGGAEPNVVRRPSDIAIWVVVLSGVGLFNSVAIYGIVALVPSAWLEQ